jgi:hypothetical protein
MLAAWAIAGFAAGRLRLRRVLCGSLSLVAHIESCGDTRKSSFPLRSGRLKA